MDKLQFRSFIPNVVVKRALIEGSVKAILGGLILLSAGAFIPVKYLSFLGIPLLLLGIGLITWGLIPYKRLKKRQDNPYKITVTPHDLVIYLEKHPITIPHSAVASLSYKEGGILIKLHSIGELPSIKAKELFLPYFSQETFEELEEILFAI